MCIILGIWSMDWVGHDPGNRKTRRLNLLYVLNASLIVEWHWRSFVFIDEIQLIPSNLFTRLLFGKLKQKRCQRQPNELNLKMRIKKLQRILMNCIYFCWISMKKKTSITIWNWNWKGRKNANHAMSLQ